jgi:hypothetical protein
MTKHTHIYLVFESIPHEGDIWLHTASSLEKAVLFLKQCYQSHNATWHDDVFNQGLGQTIIKTIVDKSYPNSEGDEQYAQFDGKGNQWSYSPTQKQWVMVQAYENMSKKQTA